MKISAVYTGAPCSLIGKVEEELRKLIPEAQIQTYTDPTIINEIIKQGKVESAQAKRLIKMYVDAVTAGADVVYNICSSVGDIADIAAPAIEAMGAYFVRIDYDMGYYAVSKAARIGIIATLPTTLEPTKHMLLGIAQKQRKDITLVDALTDAFGKSQTEMEVLLSEQAEKIADKVDIIVLAQASMAICEEKIAAACGKEVVSSPRFGAQAVKNALLANPL